MENNFDCLLLASGGMDSTVLAYKLAKENCLFHWHLHMRNLWE